MHDSVGKSGNFHILIKTDNSIHVEGEDSPRPIEHVHASDEKGEWIKPVQNETSKKKREKSVLVIFHAPCVCFLLFSYSFIETAVVSNKCLQ